MDKNVCFRLKEERSNKNVTQKVIAKVTDVSEKTVGRWESSIAIHSDKFTVLSGLGLDVRYILTGERSNASIVGKIASYSQDEVEMLQMYRNLSDEQKAVLKQTARMFADN